MRIVLKKPLDRLIMKAYYSTKNERDKKCKTSDLDFFNLLLEIGTYAGEFGVIKCTTCKKVQTQL